MLMYELIVFLHVLAAVVLLGASLLATPAVNVWIRRASTATELRRWLSAGRPLAWINPVASLTILASGVYLASVGQWWGAPWVWTALVMWMANLVLAITVTGPTLENIARAIFASDSRFVSPQVDTMRNSQLWWFTSDVMAANDVAILFLMVTKPGLVSSIIVVLGANAVGIVLRGLADRMSLSRRRIVTDAR